MTEKLEKWKKTLTVEHFIMRKSTRRIFKGTNETS